MKITPGTILDLARIASLPRARKIFLRREFEKCGEQLRRLARLYRKYFLARTRIVAVVGSLGKTTTRRAVAAALGCPDRNFSFYSYGPLLARNILRIHRHDAHGVLEAAINSPGQMQSNADTISPDIVVVTSIKSEHHRSFPTLLATQTQARVVTFGMNPDNDVRATNVETNPDGSTNLEILAGDRTFHFHNPLTGEHMIYPVLAAVAVAHLEGVEMEGALSRLGQVTPAVSRMEWLTLPNGVRILDDSFKSTQESIETVLDTFSKIPAARKIVVMGRIDEPMGKERDRYRELGARLAQFADFILIVGGDELTSLRAAAVKEGMDFEAIKLSGMRINGAHEWLQTVLKPGDVVLVKGALPQKLRRIVLQLTGKTVTCHVKYCDVRVQACDECPLLNAPESFYENYFVKRFIKL